MSDDVFAAVKELLPEIEKELRDEITTQLQAEYHQKLEEHIQRTREEAKIELETVFQEIQQQTFETFQQKLLELETREQELNQNRLFIEEDVRKDVEQTLKAQFEQEKQSLSQQVLEEFNSQMIGGEIEEKLREKIQEEMDDKLRVELEKKEKLMKINFRKKLEHEKKVLEEGLELEWKQKVDGEKKLLERERSEIARLRSLENIRLKKLEDEKKQFKLQMRDQENKYQEIVSSLQNQVCKLESELNGLQIKQQDLANQCKEVTLSDESQMAVPLSQFRQSRQSQNMQEEPIVPVYQHQKMFEDQISKNIVTSQQQSNKSENGTLKKNLFGNNSKVSSPQRELKQSTFEGCKKQDINQYLFGKTSDQDQDDHYKSNTSSILDKDTTKSFMIKYQEELNKLLITKQNKENQKINKEAEVVQQPQNVKYTEVLKRKMKEEVQVQKIVPPSSYDSMFATNDFDNEKNLQMKKTRLDVIQKLSKDLALLPKYEALQIYMQTEFLQKYQNDTSKKELEVLLDNLFDIYDMVQLNIQERIDFLKFLQFQAQPDSINALIPLIQNKVYQIKQIMQQQPQNSFELMRTREDIRNQITKKWVSYSKAKQGFSELKEISQKLKNVKMKWRGLNIDEFFKIDDWESEYLQREELKNQLLHKIQTKIL